MPKQVIATITTKSANGAENRYMLRDQAEITVGREESNDIIISDAGVSRFHASFAASMNGVVVSDLASLNGTFVNGKRLSGMKDLASSDIVQIGTTELTLVLSADDSSKTSDNSRSRAMTAQMRPLSVSVLVLRLELPEAQKVDRDIILEWGKTVESMVTEFDGEIDKKIGSTIVAVWVGDDARNQALRAIRTFQRVDESTKETIEAGSILAAVASGLGLRGPSSDESGKELNIIGDPANIAFSLAELHTSSSSQVIFDVATNDHIKDAVDVTSLGKKGEENEEVFSLA